MRIKEYDFLVEGIYPAHVEDTMDERRQANEILGGLFYGITGKDNLDNLVQCFGMPELLVSTIYKQWGLI